MPTKISPFYSSCNSYVFIFSLARSLKYTVVSGFAKRCFSLLLWYTVIHFNQVVLTVFPLLAMVFSQIWHSSQSFSNIAMLPVFSYREIYVICIYVNKHIAVVYKNTYCSKFSHLWDVSERKSQFFLVSLTKSSNLSLLQVITKNRKKKDFLKPVKGKCKSKTLIILLPNIKMIFICKHLFCPMILWSSDCWFQELHGLDPFIPSEIKFDHSISAVPERFLLVRYCLLLSLIRFFGGPSFGIL